MSVPSVPVRGSIYKFATALTSQADTKLLKSSPTLASGDAKLSTDGAAFANLGTLPTVTPSSDRRVLVTLSASEMGGQQVDVALVDAAGAEWCDQFHVIDPLVLPVLTSGTAQSGSTSSTIKLANTEPSDQNDYWKGAIVRITGGTGVGQARDVSASVQSTHVLTVVPNWDTTPDNTSTYEVVAPPGWVDPYGRLAYGIYAYVGLAYTQAEAANIQSNDALNRLGSWAGSGANTVLGAFRALVNKAAGISTPSDLTDGGGGFSNQTDSAEALRDYTASQTDVLAITNNTRVVRVVPPVMERPDSGSTAFRIEILLYDEVGNMEAPDSAPTISVVDESGTSRDVNLDSTTMTLVSTGRYRSTYTVGTGHDIEELIFAFSVTEGGATRVYANASLVVDTTAVDFTASDRADLQAILADTADMQPKQGTPATTLAGDLAALDVLIDAIKAKTDLLAFTGTDVKATLDGETVTPADGSLTTAKFGSTVWNKIADHVLRRKASSAEASADGDALDDAASLYGMVQQHRQADTTTHAGKLTIFETDGTTELEQLDLATDPAADPVTGIS